MFEIYSSPEALYLRPTNKPACKQRGNSSVRLEKKSRTGTASGAEDGCGGGDPGATGKPGTEIHTKEHGRTTAGVRPK